MVKIGYRPILWHLMKYYAHYGHREFILCLGYQANVIKDYFLNYNECASNDFVLANGGKDLHLLHTDIHDWTVTFVDTGLNSNIGQRLRSVEKYLKGDEIFLANYSDGLTDLDLTQLIAHFYEQNKIASFLCVKPNLTYHFVSMQNGCVVTEMKDIYTSDIRINGGYYIFSKDIFKYIKDGEELVAEPFQRLIKEKELIAYKYDGFFACMDTFKDKQLLEDIYTRGQAPWELWKCSRESSLRC